MTTNTKQTINTSTHAASEASRFALGAGILSAALFALWAVTCLASAIFNQGISGVIRSFFGAVTGS